LYSDSDIVTKADWAFFDRRNPDGNALAGI
jgi:hypothetical protein